VHIRKTGKNLSSAGKGAGTPYRRVPSQKKHCEYHSAFSSIHKARKYRQQVQSERRTCLGPTDVGRRVVECEFWKSDDNGADGSLSSNLSRVTHECQPRGRFPGRITDPYEKRQTVLGESSEHDVQLFFGLSDRNQIPSHLEILWFLVYHLYKQYAAISASKPQITRVGSESANLQRLTFDVGCVRSGRTSVFDRRTFPVLCST